MMSLRDGMESKPSSTLVEVLSGTMTRSHFRLFQGNVKINDFFSQRVPVESEKFGCLYLIASCLTQRGSDERAFHGGNQDRMKVFSRSVSHPLHELPHFRL